MLLQARQLSLSVSGFSLLNDIDLQVEAGQVAAIVGPNGAGKTSLLRLLSGEQKPTSGEVIFNDLSLGKWNFQQRARSLAVLPQSSELNFPFTASEVVALGRIPHSTGADRDMEIVAAALEMVDGSYLERRYYTQMSGGEKQRVQLARVLAQIWEPEQQGARLLILDEPTSAFDLAHQQLTLEIVRKLAGQGVGILMVLHDLNLAARCADQLIMLSCGRIVANGSPEQVLIKENIQQVFAVDTEISSHPISGKPLVIT